MAVVITLLAVGFLGWQYRRLEKEKIPALEERIELVEAQRTAEKFMNFRIMADQSGAMRYLTEGAVLQQNQGEFALLGNFQKYEILNTDKLEEDKFRFAVKIYSQDIAGDLVEIITLIKILNQYYIDSIQVAG